VIPAPRPPAGPSAEVAAPGVAAAAAAAADTASPGARAPAAAPDGPAEAEPRPGAPERAVGSAPPPVPSVATPDGNNYRRNWLILALAAFLALSVVLAVTLFDGEPGRQPDGQPGPDQATAQATPSGAETSPVPQESSPVAGETSAPPAQPPPAATGQPGGTPAPALPTGWQLYTDSTGFKVPVPVGWTVSRAESSWGPQVYFNGPRSRQLMIDQTWTQVKEDALLDLQAKEDYRRTHSVNYQRVGEIHRVPNYFVDAAEWDYLETINGVRMHVRVRNFITTRNKQAYMIRFRLPASEWDRVGAARFKIIVERFQPRR
jgi:hypothetical protein